MSASVADLYVTLDSITAPFSKGMKAAAAEAESQSKKIRASIGGIAKAGAEIGVGMVGAGIATVDMAAKFNKSMTLLTTQAGVAKSQIGYLSNGVLSLAGQVGFSPDSLAESLYHVESNAQSMGITAAGALDIVKIAAEGAKVGNADLVDVTNALTAAYASGIPGVQDMNQAMGMLNATVGIGDMSMQNLADAFGTGVLASVKGFGVTLADVSAGLAVFGDNNIRGALAGNEFRMAVQAIAKPVTTAGDALKKLGLTQNTLADDMEKGGLKLALQDLVDRMDKAGIKANQQGQIITDAFGRKAGTGIDILIGQFNRTMGKYPDLERGAHGFGAAWATTKAQLSTQLDDIKSEVDAVGIRVGEYLIPEFTKLLTLGQNSIGQIVSGFEGKTVTGPTVKANYHNAHLNQEMAPVAQAQTALQRFGATLHTALGDTERFIVKLKPIGEDFGRFATDLWQGGQKIVTGLEPTAKLFGEGLLAGFAGVGKILANVVGPAFKWFGDFIDSHKALIETFATVTLGTLILKMGILGTINATTGLVKLATAIVSFPQKQTAEIGTAWKGLGTAFSGGKLKDGETEIKGLKGAVTDLKGAVGTGLDKFLPFRKATKDLEDAAVGAGENLPAVAGGIGKVGTAAEEAEGSTGGLVGTLGKFAVGGLAVGAIVGGATLIGTTLGKLAGVGDHVGISLDQMVQQLQNAAEGSVSAGQDITAQAAAWAKAGSVGAGATAQFDQALTQMVQNGHAGDAKTEFAAISADLAKTGISASQAAAMFPQYSKAIKDAGDAAQTMDGRVTSMLGTISQQQALDGFQTDLQNITTTLQANKDAITGNSAAAIQNRDAFAQGATDILNYYQQQRNLGVGVIDASNQMDKQITALEQTGIKAGISKGVIDQYIATLMGMPVSEVTQIIANTEPATKSVDALIKKINGSTATITVYEDSTGTVVTPGSGGRKARAQGGPVEAMNTYLVGENGPELVTFGASGYVTPNSMLQPAILAGASSGGQVQPAPAGPTYIYKIVVQGSVISEDQLLSKFRSKVLQYDTRNSGNGLALRSGGGS